MRTRSAEKKSAGIQQTAAVPAAQPAAAVTKRTPPSRAKQAKTVGSTASPAAEASEADGAVQSTPEAKPPSGRKTPRRGTRKGIKKTPASSRTTPDKTPGSEDAGTAMLEDHADVKDAEDSKEDLQKEKDAADSKESKDAVFQDPVEEKTAEVLEEDVAKVEHAEDPKKDDVPEKDAEDLEKDIVKMEYAEASKESLKEDDTEVSKEETEASKEPVKEEDTEASKEEAEASKEPVKEEDTDGLEEDLVKEKDMEDTKEDTAKVEDVAKESTEDLKEDVTQAEDAGEQTKDAAAARENTEDLKEDVAKVEDAKELKEDSVKMEGAEDSKEAAAKDLKEEDIVMIENVLDTKEDTVMEEDTENLKEDIVKMEDAENLKENALEDSKEYPVKEEDPECSKENSVKEEDAGNSKEDSVKEKDAEDLKQTAMYEMDPGEIKESSNKLVATTENGGDSVMEDQKGNKEEQTGNAHERIGYDVGTSENKGPIVTDVKSEEPIKVSEESELGGEKDNDSTHVDAKCAEDIMEDTDKKMKGKDISLEEAGEDKIEAFADSEEFAEDDMSEHCEEAETLEDQRAQLNALAKERKKRKELEVFVGGLDRDVVEEDLKRAFQHVGEVVDVRINYDMSTNKNKGYAFVKFATKEQVSRALAEMRNPVIRGKRCGTAPSEDNDTLFLGNICNTWTKEAVRQKLKDFGVEGVENITLVADLKHEGLSRGFAFLEFSCHADAMTAYRRLQRPDVIFGHSERTAKIAFAEPLRDPDPEVMAQVKSVFIDGIPPYWDEDRVREKFKGFGEIAKITLARNMSTAKRKDFGFVDFNTHEAAVACVEGINNTELGDGNLKAKVRARLSNPLPKSHAVKGGMCGGFQISHGPIGRGFPRGGHSFGRASFPRGRGFYPRGPGHGGRMGFTEHDFGSSYPPIRGRSNFERGGRWTLSGSHPPPSGGPVFLDRMRHGGRGHADDAFIRRPQFPVEGLNRPPFMGRPFEDHYFCDNNTEHGLKRPFSMTEPDPGFLGPSRRPRFGPSDSATSLHGDRYRDNFPPGGDQYARDYYGPDYGRGRYPSFYGGDNRPYGRGYGRGYY